MDPLAPATRPPSWLARGVARLRAGSSTPAAPAADAREADAVDADGPPALDFRALPAPEPLLRALAAAEALAPGQSCTVLTPLLPTPLLDALAERGLRHEATLLRAGGARIRIRAPASVEPGDG